MVTLYYSPGTASFVVHWLLVELDLPHQLRRVEFATKQQKSTEYLALNPAGVVPTLIVDGQPMSEAAAIAMHLADTYSRNGLAPALGTRERGVYLQWMFTAANSLQPAFRSWYYPDEPAGAQHIEVVKDKARQRIEAVWERLDAHLAASGPYVLGDRLSAVDFLLTMLMRWSRNLRKTALDWSSLNQHAGLMRGRESFATVYEREGLTDWR